MEDANGKIEDKKLTRQTHEATVDNRRHGYRQPKPIRNIRNNRTCDKQ